MSLQQLIAAAVSESGTPMAAMHRALMENCFQTDFTDVRLHFSTASHCANQAMGSLAFALDNHICFRKEIEPSTGHRFCFVLAHELCHIVQQRLGTETHGNPQSLPSVNRLECEADMAAICALMGKAADRITPDPTKSTRNYGIAGHYYTAFYTAMAAGFEIPIAKEIAFFTQMPDLVSELDAHEAGTKYALAMYKELTKVWPLWPSNPLDFRGAAIRECWQIQAGLHSLTGGDSAAETKTRTARLRLLAPGSLEHGLAVHAFGDSFAHRVVDHEDKMYAAWLGHGVEGVNSFLRNEVDNDPTAPDWIAKRQLLYLAYGRQLYNIFQYANTVRVELKTFISALQEVTNEQTEAGQIQLLVSKATALFDIPDEIYRPPQRTFPWEVFRTQPEHLHLDPGDLPYALQIAAEWAGSIRNTTPSLYGDRALFDNFLDNVFYGP